MPRRAVALALCLGFVGCGGGGSPEGGFATTTSGATPTGTGTPGTEGGEGGAPSGKASPAGLFISRAGLDRLGELLEAGAEPFLSNFETLEARAEAALAESARPFRADNIRALRFGWCEAPDGSDDTLRELTRKLERQSDTIRSLALTFAITAERPYGDHALAMLLDWAFESTLLNLHDLDIDFAAGRFDGMTEDGICGYRPWNFALDALWQTYGLINLSDAYLLLERNGYPFSPDEEAALEEFLLALTEAVNASFQAWTRWADAHPDASSYERYRSDNHLSWALAGLVSGAAALGDEALARYALEGGAWEDRRGGRYENPSHARALIERAIESSGRIYEERILRDPPIGYALFHLWALTLLARTGELHFGRDLFTYKGAGGAGLEEAYERYSAYVLGEKGSPTPAAESDLLFHRWQWEFAYERWGKPRFLEVVEAAPRDVYVVQSVGPVTLLIGAEPARLEPPGPTVEEPPGEPEPEEPSVEEPPPEEDPEAPAAPFFETSSLSQFGITWTFGGNVTAGRFANGDYWVVGPVSITGIDPPSRELSGRTRNGSMLNPSPRLGNVQGYDSATESISYRASLNAALDVSPARPLLLEPGASLVSSVSLEEAGHRPQLRSAAVLTVLSSIPPEGSFRPPYAGGEKTVRFQREDLDYGLLQRLEPVGSTPALSVVERYFERPWIDHVPGWTGRFHHPAENMPDYGRDMSSQVGAGALMLHLDFPNAAKERLLVRYVQLGIDLFGVLEDGGEENWTPNGGHASGRKWPILFAGLLLGEESMWRIGEHPTALFGEDAQTFYVEETSPAVYNWGYGGYDARHVGLPEYGIRHATRLSMDDLSWDSSYRQCCTASAWNGFVLAAHIMGVKGLWNHDALFDYEDRFMAVQTDVFRSASRFTEEMWDAYRASYGGMWTR